MMAPPMVMARNDRVKLVWKNRRRSQARRTSSQATTAMATRAAVATSLGRGRAQGGEEFGAHGLMADV
jgi:hypothetical protein